LNIEDAPSLTDDEPKKVEALLPSLASAGAAGSAESSAASGTSALSLCTAGSLKPSSSLWNVPSDAVTAALFGTAAASVSAELWGAVSMSASVGARAAASTVSAAGAIGAAFGSRTGSEKASLVVSDPENSSELCPNGSAVVGVFGAVPLRLEATLLAPLAAADRVNAPAVKARAVMSPGLLLLLTGVDCSEVRRDVCESLPVLSTELRLDAAIALKKPVVTTCDIALAFGVGTFEANRAEGAAEELGVV
jgi:hypothetical protein